MSTASEGALPEPLGGVRATDADRARVVARLRAAAGEGAIDLDELEQRITAVYDARSVADLSAVTVDLPMGLAPPGARPPQHRRPVALEDDEFRQHLTSYCLVMALLLVIWLAAGAHFPWPFIVAAAWGIGLGSHYQVASAHQRTRLARATAEGISLDELARREAEERRRRRKRRHEGPDELAPPGRAGPAAHRPSAPPTASTRFVVAMFVDVAGSTELNEALGDEQWAVVRRSFRDLVDEVVRDHGGWEVSCSGDGVLVRFQHPSAAADAAVTILRRLELRRQSGFAPSVRIGIHSGDAVEEGDDIIGNVVNLAARVTEVAERDEAVVTEHVADHLDGRHSTTGRGLHTLKGVGRPRHLLSLDWR